ncbi:MAG: hypothetical protein A2494_03910 [Candidatus Lloydbacteria bacterium RIFOXYC12_FULL_46_25]|uniref:Uncharacterized protein n=1 Tax=Candidatus Lloydbacteria bacterium RIFOXYC12_FULL_46_25 TaxID=1798670 RepID=A0A1G2DYE9_9BACT|nr:MAG: hypothetical protein A2494_03910 [Candidatus Lloydbacteria bacterium RIFOXYC12_FULL_46_25]
MPIISTEVVEKDGNFVGLTGPQIASIVSWSEVRTRHMVVIPDLELFGDVDEFVADATLVS